MLKKIIKEGRLLRKVLWDSGNQYAIGVFQYGDRGTMEEPFIDIKSQSIGYEDITELVNALNDAKKIAIEWDKDTNKLSAEVLGD